ncbi:PglZ domain-containing protein [Gammaproteobacteria bacterium]|nr:PglZ domain-containing protein [Gammaproteobacteria bacterium]
MSITHYIQHEVLLPRARDARVLVVYDAERRYRDLCLGLANDELQVVDASESSIESRDAALQSFVSLGAGNGSPAGLLIYVPAKAPISKEDSQRDPFSIYSVCGATFPNSDGDEYQNLCLKAKPDQQTAIRKIFAENANPEFSVIDKVGGGSGWPNCQAVLNAESARDILFGLLVPNETQAAKLAESDTWVSEAKDLFKAALGLALKTRAKSWSLIADEMWRFVLYSEFVFDLPEDLPAALGDVPHADDSARPLVQELCERLRNDQRTQSLYIDRAEAIEQELNLQSLCEAITNLGHRDTFPFEERTFFARAVAALQQDDIEAVRAILYYHADSVWVGKGESQAQWGLLRAGLALIGACDDNERELVAQARSQEQLIDYYLTSLREVDRLQREFEQAYGDHIEFDAEDVLAPVVEQARSHYRQLVGKAQAKFTQHLETSGWPPTGRLANADVFDQLVAPALQQAGCRVAYIQVDALRYELGVALHQQLAEDDPFEIQAAYAQLPSITRVGMASLLPGAGQLLRLQKKDDDYAVMLGAAKTETVPERMKIFAQKYGDRFAEMQLKDFVRSKQNLDESVDLLVLRSVDIDSVLENNPEMTLKLVHDTLKLIRVGVNKLRNQGFEHVVIATDHGFFLNAQAEAGDVCQKPPGNWITEHERCLLGNGSEDSNNFVVPIEKVGIQGDLGQFGGPRSMAPYRKGMLYFHGGASLQEAVVPVISAKLNAIKQPSEERAQVTLSYKNGATRVTTLLPVVQVLLETDMFSQGVDFEILLEAHDKKGEVVGEAKHGDSVNPATGTVTLKPGEQMRIPVKMLPGWEGKFTLKALDPKSFMVYASLELTTDYLV